MNDEIGGVTLDVFHAINETVSPRDESVVSQNRAVQTFVRDNHRKLSMYFSTLEQS